MENESENESENDIERAFRAACQVSSELPNVDRYKSYDKAFIHYATDLIVQAEIILAHCKDESIKVEVREDRDVVELSRREWPVTGAFTQVFTYVHQDGADLRKLPPEYVKALAAYVLLLEGISSIKQKFQMYLLQIAMKAIEEDFQQAEQDIKILLGHAEGVVARRSLPIGKPGSPEYDRLHRSVLESARVLASLDKRFKELLAVQADPEAIIKMFLSFS